MAGPRSNRNFSFLKFNRILSKGRDHWTEEEHEFASGYLDTLVAFEKRLPEMCEAGNVDALFLALERCRGESPAKVGSDDWVMLPRWLADALRGHLTQQWLKGIPGVRGRHATTDARLRAAYMHFHRYSVVEDCREEGMSIWDAVQEAPKRFNEPFGSEDDFARSHKLVAKALKADPDRYLMVLVFGSTMTANLKSEGEA